MITPPISHLPLVKRDLVSSFAWANCTISEPFHHVLPIPVIQHLWKGCAVIEWLSRILAKGLFINCELSKTCHTPLMPGACKHTVLLFDLKSTVGEKVQWLLAIPASPPYLQVEGMYLTVTRVCDTEQIHRSCSFVLL